MSHTETPSGSADIRNAIDSSAWSGFQKTILAVTALAVIMDGFDNQLIGFAVPAIMADWQIPKDSFGPVLAISLLAMTIGTFLGGLAGDKVGRRPALIASMLILALGTGLAAFSQDLTQLALLRWAAAIGLGGAMPNATALLAEYTPVAKRSVAVTLAIIGVPIGGVVAGLVAASLLTTSGWRGLFMVGGALSLATTALIFIWLPESPNHLLRFPEKHEKFRRVMQRCGITVAPGAVLNEGQEQKRPSIFLFLSPAFLIRTLLLWGAFSARFSRSISSSVGCRRCSPARASALKSPAAGLPPSTSAAFWAPSAAAGSWTAHGIRAPWWCGRPWVRLWRL